MKPMIKKEEISRNPISGCHGGEGAVVCRSLLEGYPEANFAFMHHDEMAAGVSIGPHLHTEGQEVYYLLSGTGVLTFDGVEYEMNPGDISLCGIGHSHGFRAVSDCVLIVVA